MSDQPVYFGLFTKSPLCDICGLDKDTKQECGYMGCPKLWDEARIDRIGQNGNTAEHYEEVDDNTNI